ncbi:hypothetical protein C9I92_13090 [Photobacterium ganghwense]|nr:hypothetical protein C9I92_13090 [Photobacterium ganghwense]
MSTTASGNARFGTAAQHSVCLLAFDAMTLMILRGCSSSFVRRHLQCPPHYQVFPQKGLNLTSSLAIAMTR